MNQMYKNHKFHLAWILGPAIAGGLLLVALLLAASPLFHVDQTGRFLSIEAGSDVRPKPADFLSGASWSLALSSIDQSAVSYDIPGTYPITIRHGFASFEAEIRITDTTSPTLDCAHTSVTILKGETVSPSSLGITAVDNGVLEDVSFERLHPNRANIDGDEPLPENLLPAPVADYTFQHGGIYELTTTATDSRNNSASLTLTIVVEEAPNVYCPSDIYLAIGEQITYTDYLSVWDFLDEGLTLWDVVIDDTSVSYDLTGNYPVTFTAKDSYGLSTTATLNLHLYNRLALQEMINTHRINRNEDIILGAYNLYDSGYYEANNPEIVQEAMLPAIVHIENYDLGNFGSGYILKIDPLYVTIATNWHVIDGTNAPEIFFHNGVSATGLVVASDPRIDVAFVRIPVEEAIGNSYLPFEVVETLCTVNISRRYWDSIPNDDPINICYNCIDTNAESWIKTTGYMIYKEVVRTWNEYEDINECIISPDPVHGTSGSAIFDGYGHLIAMMRGYTTYYDESEYIETVAVPLSEILAFYAQVFGEPLEYQ